MARGRVPPPGEEKQAAMASCRHEPVPRRQRTEWRMGDGTRSRYGA